MELTALYQRVIGLDVHQAKITACAIVEHNDGEIEIIEREFGAFKRDRRALAEWARELAPERVVMESTGTYWKSPYAALEKVGIHAMVVNARHAKGVPGRKTDIADARWLATLARAGLLRGSFVPPAQMRQLRLVSRQRQKLVGQCSAEKNRLHKILTDAGIRLNVVVSDIHGQAARAMIKSLIDGRPLHEVLDRKGRLRASREELLEALNTDEFSAVHRFVAAEILEHIEQLEQRIARMDRYLLDALKDHVGRTQGPWAAAGPARDHSGCRPPGGCHAAGRDRDGDERLRQCRADRLLGGHLSGQQRKRWKAQEWTDPAGQSLDSSTAVRICPGGGSNSLWSQGQVRVPDGAQGLQEGHRRPGPQDAAHHLRHAQQRDSLQGQHRRLRGTDRSPECAALAEDAAQARIYYRRCYGVTGQTRGRTDSVLVWS